MAVFYSPSTFKMHCGMCFALDPTKGTARVQDGCQKMFYDFQKFEPLANDVMITQKDKRKDELIR